MKVQKLNQSKKRNRNQIFFPIHFKEVAKATAKNQGFPFWRPGRGRVHPHFENGVKIGYAFVPRKMG